MSKVLAFHFVSQDPLFVDRLLQAGWNSCLHLLSQEVGLSQQAISLPFLSSTYL